MEKVESDVLSPEPVQNDQAPRAEIYEAQQEGGDKQIQSGQYLGGEAEPPLGRPICAIEARFMNMKAEAELNEFR